MNVYDFDGTVYDGDSTLAFLVHCVSLNPRLLAHVPSVAWCACMERLGRCGRDELKQHVFQTVLPRIDVPVAVGSFWKSHSGKLRGTNALGYRPGDVIASASPAFLLEPIAERLQMALVATIVDVSTGDIIGGNARGTRKLSKFAEAFPGVVPDAFYTDDLSADAPMAGFARHVFHVKGESVVQVR